MSFHVEGACDWLKVVDAVLPFALLLSERKLSRDHGDGSLTVAPLLLHHPHHQLDQQRVFVIAVWVHPATAAWLRLSPLSLPFVVFLSAERDCLITQATAETRTPFGNHKTCQRLHTCTNLHFHNTMARCQSMLPSAGAFQGPSLWHKQQRVAMAHLGL